MSGILSDIPNGMFRVIEQVLDTGGSIIVGDFVPREAENLARSHNMKRKLPLDSAYWVYDDESFCVLDHYGRDLISVTTI
ncbi:hypothetical protein A2392_00875 [Candidatus Kaiserbacteria bacterium RIFOXYB1_FULL_46_14]|uniref:Uncharacterized protein n=1 Tax=Candidatus Kaiserbacteria bacterium RIFOXYB1_FULL_46_14 TaxID=1798531 RepID=A0A1F6FJH8_9BACT|nr:MAG: hypothetical protein A2392_00875 [Candidatus Kaiserbacteria bacterium RIFOXYB1_FULL_46_14]